MPADSSTPDLSTRLAGLSLSTCIYNASGPRSGTAEALTAVAKSTGTGAVLTKSATLLAQDGNPLPRTWHAPNGLASLNSEGLPNRGIDYYIGNETVSAVLADDNNKPYIVSLSGKTLDDNIEMLKRISKSDAPIAAIELNVACPTVIGKPIVGYDFDQLATICQTVRDLCKTINLPPIGLKLPPYLDVIHFEQVARILNAHTTWLKYIVSINTLGNALSVDLDTQAPPISANAGFAGLSGPAVHYTALANVRRFRLLLSPEIDIVGVGGVDSGETALALILAGARAVQIGTCHWKEGPSCFERIANELRELMTKYKYKSIDDVYNKWQAYDKERANQARKKSANTTKTTSSAKQETVVADNMLIGGLTEVQLYQLLSMILAALLSYVVMSQSKR
jgi:dihydroorotate dehydrogenase (fumarate)